MIQLSQSPLGKSSQTTTQYDPSLLFSIPRSQQRDKLTFSKSIPFHGADVWNAFELSWLNPKGKPQIARAEIIVPCDSPKIVESKSMKLYLYSFTETTFHSIDELQQAMTQDLSAACGANVRVKLLLSNTWEQTPTGCLPGHCLDELDVDVSHYDVKPSLLTTQPQLNKETLHSNLLKSNCLVTGQPDWASVLVKYEGNHIDHDNLLKYIISFRHHQEFHEHCVERIFHDVLQQCQPKKLTVLARFTRRGGIDINPFRSNFEELYPNIRLVRQ